MSYTWGLNTQSATTYQTIIDPQGANGTITCLYRYDKPALLSRSVSFDGTTIALTQTFTYSTVWSTQNNGQDWSSKQTIVTTQDNVRGTSSKIVYLYSPNVSGEPLTPNINNLLVDSQVAVEQTVTYEDSTGHVLRTVNKSWANAQQLVTEQDTLENGQTSETSQFYGSGGVLTEKDEYDFGPSAPGPLLRKTTTGYQPFPITPIFAAASSILDRPCQTIVYDGSGNHSAETDSFYDGGTTSSPCGTAGTPSVQSVGSLPTGTHDETDYSSTSTAPRGNLTTVIKLCLQAAPACASGSATTTYTYDETGQTMSMTDPCGNSSCTDMPTGSGHTTLYSYGDSYASGDTYTTGTNPSGSTNAYLTQITYPQTNGVSHIESFSYDFPSGQLTVSKDENGQSTSYRYDDALARLTQSNYPDGGQTTNIYNDASPNPSVTTTKLASPDPSATSIAVMDGAGHTIQTKLTSDTTEGTDYTATTYDGFGRTYQSYNATRCSPPTSNCGESTWGLTTNYYDALGRTTIVVPPDGTLPTGTTCPSNDVCTSYSGNTTTVTDEAGHSRQSTTDGLGRRTKLIESPGGLGFETDYQYDTLNDLICAVQKGTDTTPFSNCASASLTWRPRSFVYNSLAQLTTATNPESGTVCYGTLSGTTCQQNGYDANGNLIYKTDARGIQTNSTYDALNRLTLNTYSDGTNPAGYNYDTDTNYTGFGVNAVGRLSYYTDGRTFGYHFTYDVMGRPTKVWECIVATPALPGTPCPLVTYSYDLLGDETSLGNPAGPALTQTFDGAARVSSLTSSWSDAQHPAALATPDPSLGYYPGGGIRKLLLGNGLTETVAYNDRVQPCRMNVNSTAGYYTHCNDAAPGGSVLDLTAGYNLGTGDNGNVWTWSATGPQTFNRSYSYDAMNRVSTMSAPGDACSGLSWTYDAWGNRTDQTVTGGSCGTFHDTVTTANQLTGSPYAYDASGNMIHDASHSYFYDAENRLVQVDGTSGTCSTATACYLYDFATGRRIQKTVGTATTSYMRDTAGNVIAEWGPGCGSSCWTTIYAYLGSRLLAEYWNSTTYFVHQDHLGSTRLLTGYPTATPPVECDDYLPFGETIPCGANTFTTHKFTGKERDSESGLDNFGARYFTSQMGRFMSPDPLVGASPDFVQTTDPQSWNAYSYVRNNPLSNVDPDGLDCVYIGDNSVSVKTGDCYSDTDNGIFVNGTINTNSFTYNSQTQTLGFNYTNDDTGALGSGVIAGVAPSSPPTSTDYLNAVAQGTQMSRPIVEPAFWATMGFLGTFGPGILESSLALPGAGLTIPGGGIVIGKMGDLGNLGPGERTLDLPDQGNPQGNWAQNASKLRQAMNDGQPIRDASAGKPGSDTGFLRAERNLLQNHGWSLQSDGYWHPPGK